MVFVYAFFTFSWCMRQYNFAAVLVASAPMAGERNVSDHERKAFGQRAARVLSMAANQFNFGLRAYYFGMATLAWFIHPWFFMAVTTGVVLVLYRREFHSDVLKGHGVHANFHQRLAQGVGLVLASRYDARLD
ncbi:hypothetical protein SSTU70S_03901 [Stutzerimonas stutzeri]